MRKLMSSYRKSSGEMGFDIVPFLMDELIDFNGHEEYIETLSKMPINDKNKIKITSDIIEKTGGEDLSYMGLVQLRVHTKNVAYGKLNDFDYNGHSYWWNMYSKLLVICKMMEESERSNSESFEYKGVDLCLTNGCPRDAMPNMNYCRRCSEEKYPELSHG